MSRNDPFFILGMRRSGTSILRKIIEHAPGVASCEFEPRLLWWCITQGHLARFKRHPAVVKELQRFDSLPGLHGCKFALDPGQMSFYWRHCYLRWPRSRFIFIRRNHEDTYASYAKLDGDSVQGIVPPDIHAWFHMAIYNDFARFAKEYPNRAVFLEYESLLKDPGKTLAPAWALLGAKLPAKEARIMLRRPAHTKGLK